MQPKNTELLLSDNKIDNFMGSTARAAGYSLIIFGLIGTYFKWTGLILVIAGAFMSFTYEGTRIDFIKRRIKSYTALFGIMKFGKWLPVDSFTSFNIYRSRRSYTTYSRANLTLTEKNDDIRLAFLNKDKSRKIVINKYKSFSEARDEMTQLIKDLHLSGLNESHEKI